MSEHCADMQFFTQKKVFISFILSLFVAFRHSTAFPLYGQLPYPVYVLYVFLRWGITPVAVPLFIMISGVLFYRDYTPDKYTAKLHRRVRTLIIPFLCWNTINMMLEIAETTLLGRFFVEHEKIVITPMNLLLGVFHYHYNSPFWTILALIVFAVCAPIFDRILRNRYVAVIAIAFIAELSLTKVDILDFLISSQNSVVFYLVGAYIGRFHWDWFASVSNKTERSICAAIVIISAGICLNMSLHNRFFPELLSDGLLIIVALCFWRCFDFVMLKFKPKFLPAFMSHFFFLYALHMNLGKGFARVFYYLLPKHWIMAPVNFLLTTLALLGFIEVLCFSLKKFCPPFYQMLSGGRGV